MYFFLDNRETYLKERLSGVTCANLDIGDVVVSASATDPSPDALLMVFERKTLADLVSSIKDGRHHEQKARLLEWRRSAVPGRRRVYYVIEGWRPNSPDKMQVSAVINTLFRDDIAVVLLKDASETLAFFTETFNRFTTEPAKYSATEGGTGTEADYISQVKMKKNKNITPANVLVFQLSQIPGISTKIAQGIAAAHPTMSAFVRALDALESPVERAKYVENIPIGDNRKVGKKTAIKILEHV
jgi:ERCC4-type nuclease